MWYSKQNMVKEKKKGEKNHKDCSHVIYELKEVHFSLEEAQTKTQTELEHGL